MLQRLVLLALLIVTAEAFLRTAASRRFAGGRASSSQQLGAGFGAAAPAKKKSKKTKKGPSFDVNASVLRLEKLYDKLTLQHAKSLNSEDEDELLYLTEYIVAVKAAQYDWVPVAQVCLLRPHGTNETPDTLTSVVSKYCRELSFVASLGSNVFQSIPRDQYQYAVESSDSFHKFVYEPLEKHQDESPMSTEQAREILDIHNGESIKRQYRLLSKEFHPDRFVNTNQSEDEAAEAARKYEQIQNAYDVLRNVGDSWYAGLGGRARTDFRKLELTSIDNATKHLEATKVIQCGVVALDPELVQGFVARSRN